MEVARKSRTLGGQIGLAQHDHGPRGDPEGAATWAWNRGFLFTMPCLEALCWHGEHRRKLFTQHAVW